MLHTFLSNLVNSFRHTLQTSTLYPASASDEYPLSGPSSFHDRPLAAGCIVARPKVLWVSRFLNIYLLLPAGCNFPALLGWFSVDSREVWCKFFAWLNLVLIAVGSFLWPVSCTTGRRGPFFQVCIIFFQCSFMKVRVCICKFVIRLLCRNSSLMSGIRIILYRFISATLASTISGIQSLICTCYAWFTFALLYRRLALHACTDILMLGSCVTYSVSLIKRWDLNLSCIL